MKKDIKLIFEDGNELEVFYGTTVRDVIKSLNDDNIMALRINGQAVSNDYEINENGKIRLEKKINEWLELQLDIQTLLKSEIYPL